MKQNEEMKERKHFFMKKCPGNVAKRGDLDFKSSWCPAAAASSPLDLSKCASVATTLFLKTNQHLKQTKISKTCRQCKPYTVKKNKLQAFASTFACSRRRALPASHLRGQHSRLKIKSYQVTKNTQVDASCHLQFMTCLQLLDSYNLQNASKSWLS